MIASAAAISLVGEFFDEALGAAGAAVQALGCGTKIEHEAQERESGGLSSRVISSAGTCARVPRQVDRAADEREVEVRR